MEEGPEVGPVSMEVLLDLNLYTIQGKTGPNESLSLLLFVFEVYGSPDSQIS